MGKITVVTENPRRGNAGAWRTSFQPYSLEQNHVGEFTGPPEIRSHKSAVAAMKHLLRETEHGRAVAGYYKIIAPDGDEMALNSAYESHFGEAPVDTPRGYRYPRLGRAGAIKRVRGSRNPRSKLKLTAVDALNMLQRNGIDPEEDFHALPSSKVDALLEEMKHTTYKAPAHRSGSKARYFFQYVKRLARNRAKLAKRIAAGRNPRRGDKPIESLTLTFDKFTGLYEVKIHFADGSVETAGVGMYEAMAKLKHQLVKQYFGRDSPPDPRPPRPYTSRKNPKRGPRGSRVGADNLGKQWIIEAYWPNGWSGQGKPVITYWTGPGGWSHDRNGARAYSSEFNASETARTKVKPYADRRIEFIRVVPR